MYESILERFASVFLLRLSLIGNFSEAKGGLNFPCLCFRENFCFPEVFQSTSLSKDIYCWRQVFFENRKNEHQKLWQRESRVDLRSISMSPSSAVLWRLPSCSGYLALHTWYPSGEFFEKSGGIWVEFPENFREIPENFREIFLRRISGVPEAKRSRHPSKTSPWEISGKSSGKFSETDFGGVPEAKTLRNQ